MKKSDIYWQTYLNLEKEIIEVSKFIFITDEKIVNKNGTERIEPCYTQLGTFSPHIADLLVRCCIQIEAISKELYYELKGEKKRGDSSIKFDADCLKLIDKTWNTHKKSVLVVAPYFNLTREENNVLWPLKEAHKPKGTYWERAYQAVKHDRYACLCAGNVKALLQAMAALYLLNIYYRKDTWVTRYRDIAKDDYRMGASLFAVKPPVVGQLWYGNQPLESESPFVVSYQDSDYKRIEDMQRTEFEALKRYWQQQPELKEPEFIAQLTKAIEKQKEDPTQRVMHIWELAKYRLNKLIPDNLPFEEKKTRLISSEAWNCWTNKNSKHLTPAEMTEENIQSEINSIAIRWGMDIERRFEKMEWIQIALNKEICRVYIP